MPMSILGTSPQGRFEDRWNRTIEPQDWLCGAAHNRLAGLEHPFATYKCHFDLHITERLGLDGENVIA